jgi:hypothetical protein
MPHDKADDDLRERLWSMPFDERCAMLICSIVEHNPLMPHTAYAILDLLMKVASGLGEENGRKLAEQMHGAADCLESCTRPVGDGRHAMH